MSAPRTAAEVQEWKCGCRHTFEEHASNCRFAVMFPSIACHCPVSQAELVVELLREARVEEMRRISGVLNAFANLPTGVAEIAALLGGIASIMEDLS
jgi:hypothetical protein